MVLKRIMERESWGKQLTQVHLEGWLLNQRMCDCYPCAEWRLPCVIVDRVRRITTESDCCLLQL